MNFRVFGKEAEMFDIHKNSTFRLDFFLWTARVIGNSCKYFAIAQIGQPGISKVHKKLYTNYEEKFFPSLEL